MAIAPPPAAAGRAAPAPRADGQAAAPASRPASAWAQSLRALGGQYGDQWERDRRDTLFLMGAIVLAVLPHLGHLPWWTSLGFGLLFLWRFGLVLSGRWLPRDSVRWVAAIACTIAVWAHYRTLLGREPGVALLVLFLGLKLMEMRARRDLFVVIFLCFFLLITAFFHSQTLFTAALCLVAVLALLAAMLTMQFGHREQSIGTRFRSAATLLLQALPIAALFFVLFPRLDGPLWGAPDDMPGARTGLSDSMSPGGIADLSNSDEVAFRVQFDRARPPAKAMYWRGPVFGTFDGTAWRALAKPVAPLPLPSIEAEARDPINYQITLEPHQRTWLFALDAPVSVDQMPQGAPMLRPDMQLVSRDRIHERTRYRLESRLEYRFGLNETPATLQNWLGLPAGFNPKARQLGAAWQSQEDDPARIVQRALTLFGEKPFRYTMRPALLGRDSVDEFLFKTREGFCEHYASAFTVLMRAAGVPARVVTGYQGGELNPVDGFWLVRQADAHAWAEVWLADRGWTRVDPTSAIAPERIERGARSIRREGLSLDAPLITQLRFNLDALSNAWNQWVLSYDHTRQQRLLASLGLSMDDWQPIIALLAAGLAVLIGGVALVTLHPRLPRDPVQRWYTEFCRRLAIAGIVRAPHETPLQLLARSEALLDEPHSAQARGIVRLYNRLRFGGEPAQGKDVADLRALVTAFKP